MAIIELEIDGRMEKPYLNLDINDQIKKIFNESNCNSKGLICTVQILLTPIINYNCYERNAIKNVSENKLINYQIHMTRPSGKISLFVVNLCVCRFVPCTLTKRKNCRGMKFVTKTLDEHI